MLRCEEESGILGVEPWSVLRECMVIIWRSWLAYMLPDRLSGVLLRWEAELEVARTLPLD